MKFGIVGVGYVGRALTALVTKHGHQAMLSNSRGPKSLYTTAAMLKCEAGTVAEATAFGDLVVLAVPFYAYEDLDADAFAGRLVIDAGNYHPKRDGQVALLDERKTTSSEMLAQKLPRARIVKAFNAILAPDLEEIVRSGPSSPRRALPIAGNDPEAKDVVIRLHDELGFEGVDVGPLSESWRFETNKGAYCARLNRAGLLHRIATSERNVEFPYGHWDA